MRHAHIEHWVLTILDRVAASRPVEDSRVELKAEWPEPTRAARRLAGHANAARGEAILWVIGVDEKAGIVTLPANDIASWLAQVMREFDSVQPAATDLCVSTRDGTVVALLFDTSRAPYVVRNPVFGLHGGGSVAFEVPWREGTAVRTARREELLRILVPEAALPDIEVLSADLSVGQATVKRGRVEKDMLVWAADVSLYVTPRSSERVVLPVHRWT